MSIMYKFRFEFLELSDWFEYGLKAVGSQARQRCHPVVCRLETIVEGTCLLYKMYIDVFRFLTFLTIGTAPFGEIQVSSARAGVVWLNMDGHM